MSISRRTSSVSVKSAIDLALENFKLKSKVMEAAIVEQWGELAGGIVEKETYSLRLNEGVLHLRMRNATVRQELGFQKQLIISRVNDFLGQEIVKDLHIS